jgi:hypothetical protein
LVGDLAKVTLKVTKLWTRGQTGQARSKSGRTSQVNVKIKHGMKETLGEAHEGKKLPCQEIMSPFVERQGWA